jgi:site-specific recombinase XerD
MLGHKSITQTQRYAKVLPESVFADFTRVENLSNNYKTKKQ